MVVSVEWWGGLGGWSEALIVERGHVLEICLEPIIPEGFIKMFPTRVSRFLFQAKGTSEPSEHL